jgi:hypothetical protein
MARKRKSKRTKKPQTPADRLHKTAFDLVRFHEQRSKKAGALPPAESRQALLLKTDFLDAAKAFKATKDKDGDPPSLDIGDFFGKVSAGVVQAQRNLDDQSADYLKTIAAQPNALPSIFRIPKVSAELKFALDTTNDKGLNLIFFKDQQRAEQLNQQTIQFDIVSAPPPPNFTPPPALANIVRLKSDRQTIQSNSKLPPSVNDFDRVIILEIIDTLQKTSDDSAARRYLLLFADKGGNLGIWWLQVLLKTGAATFSTVLSFGVPDPSLASLQAFISGAGDLQKDFLSKLP